MIELIQLICALGASFCLGGSVTILILTIQGRLN